MPYSHGFVAWIEPKEDHCAAAFVSGATRELRAPATGLFSSVDEAHRWVEQEAAAVGGVPIAWLDQPRHAGRGESLAAELFGAA
jgi:hypothetical protein